MPEFEKHNPSEKMSMHDLLGILMNDLAAGAEGEDPATLGLKLGAAHYNLNKCLSAMYRRTADPEKFERDNLKFTQLQKDVLEYFELMLVGVRSFMEAHDIEELIGVAAAALAEVNERLNLYTEPGSRLRVLSLLDFICAEGRMPTDMELGNAIPVKNLLEFISSIVAKEEEDNDGKETEVKTT